MPPSESAAADMTYLLRTPTKLTDDEIAEAWRLYLTCMEPVEIHTPQAHVMSEGDFKQMMYDERITKGLVLDRDGALSAFGTYTTDLTALPLLSWKFYRHWWPDEYERNAIIYVPFIVSGGHHRAYRAFVEHVYALAAPLRGLVCVDVSDYNEDVHHFVNAIAVTTRRLSHGESRHYKVGYQSYVVYDPTGQATYPTELLQPGQPTGDIDEIAAVLEGTIPL
jgi:hypothetical protein